LTNTWKNTTCEVFANDNGDCYNSDYGKNWGSSSTRIRIRVDQNRFFLREEDSNQNHFYIRNNSGGFLYENLSHLGDVVPLFLDKHLSLGENLYAHDGDSLVVVQNLGGLPDNAFTGSDFLLVQTGGVYGIGDVTRLFTFHAKDSTTPFESPELLATYDAFRVQAQTYGEYISVDVYELSSDKLPTESHFYKKSQDDFVSLNSQLSSICSNNNNSGHFYGTYVNAIENIGVVSCVGGGGYTFAHSFDITENDSLVSNETYGFGSVRAFGGEFLTIGGRYLQKIQKSMGRVISTYYSYNKKGYNNSSPDLYIANRFTTQDSISSSQSIQVAYDVPYCVTEYNHLSYLPHFECATVTQNDGSLGYQLYRTYVDEPNNPLVYNNTSKIGRLAYSYAYRGDSSILSFNSINYGLTTNGDTWPNGVSFLNALSTTSASYDSSSNIIHHTSNQHQYNPDLNVPYFSSSSSNGRSQITQNFIDSFGRIYQTASYDYTLGTTPVNLDNASTNSLLPYTIQNNFSLIGRNEVTYSSSSRFKHKVDQVYTYIADNTSFTEELKQGTEPDFNLSPYLVSAVTRRNPYGQPIEMLSYNGLDGNGDTLKTYSSIIYEGRGSIPYATFSYAKRQSVVAIGFENGSVSGLNTFDAPSYPTNTQGSYFRPAGSYDDEIVHAGRYSYKLDSNSSFSINLYLTESSIDTLDHQSDYIISAWIYTESTTQDVFTLSLSGILGTPPKSYQVSEPVEGSRNSNTWQRYEIQVPYNDIKDYTYPRININIGDSHDGKVTYIDDVVAYPVHSNFSLTTYNQRRQAMDVTNMYHLVQRHKYDRVGRLVFTQDVRGNTFNQSGIHRLGENQ
jgi:hypothetical protein